jgi:dTDP-4-amino-4,6-dideoxygalactose transaminase
MVRLIKPYIGFDEVKSEFEEILDSGILTRGKYSKLLPECICDYTGAKYAFNATSATTALSACLKVLNVGPGSEVVVSDFSFPATANVVEECGAVPIFADVSLETYNMLPEQLESKITKKTKAVIFVSALGNPDGLTEIKKICCNHNIPLINDAACGIGSSIEKLKVGNIADFECFSFHPRKLLTSGEGGAITTNNYKYAQTLEIILMHGAKIQPDGHMDFVTYGYNYRLPELQCVMLIKQISKLDSIVAERNAQRLRYSELLEPYGFVHQKHNVDKVIHNMQSIVFSVPCGTDRDRLSSKLKLAGVETTIGTYCLSNCTYFKNKYKNVQSNAVWLEKNTLTLPCYNGVDINFVCDAIRRCL